MRNWQVTTQNRNAAKRLLNAWHDSRTVRTWTLMQLNFNLTQAVNDGLMTDEGIERALGNSSKPKDTGRDDNDGHRGKRGRDDESLRDERDGQGSGDVNGDVDGDNGDGNGNGDGDAQREQEMKDAFDAGYDDGLNGDTKDASQVGESNSESYEAGYEQGQQERNNPQAKDGDNDSQYDAAMQAAKENGKRDQRAGKDYDENRYDMDDLQSAYRDGYDEATDEAVIVAMIEAYERGRNDGEQARDSDNPDNEMDAEQLHGEHGDEYERGFNDGLNGRPDERDDESKDNDEDGDEMNAQRDESNENLVTCEDCQSLVVASAIRERFDGKKVCPDCFEDGDEELHHEVYDRVLKYVSAGINVALVGPAGTGKSFLARQVADALGIRFYVNGAAMSKYDLIGYKDAHGEYHSTPAYDAFVNGGLHCFDELDASAPEAVVAFNGMTDDQPVYTFPCGQREQHAAYVAMACMNTYGNGASADYVGRFKQDAAAMDRFVTVYMGYDERIERRICGKHADIMERIRDLRTACDMLGIRKVTSYRRFKFAVAARDAGVTRRDIDHDILFAGLDENAITQVKAQMKELRKART